MPRLPAGAGMTDEMGRAAWRGRISTNIDRNEARPASLKSGDSQFFKNTGLRSGRISVYSKILGEGSRAFGHVHAQGGALLVFEGFTKTQQA